MNFQFPLETAFYSLSSLLRNEIHRLHLAACTLYLPCHFLIVTSGNSYRENKKSLLSARASLRNSYLTTESQVSTWGKCLATRTVQGSTGSEEAGVRATVLLEQRAKSWTWYFFIVSGSYLTGSLWPCNYFLKRKLLELESYTSFIICFWNLAPKMHQKCEVFT